MAANDILIDTAAMKDCADRLSAAAQAVAADLRRNFRGVGNETCAAVLEQVAADYKHLIQSLEEQMRL